MLGHPGHDGPKPRRDHEDETHSNTTRFPVVVGVDGSPASDAAVCWAAGEAAMRTLPMKLIHVMTPTPGNSTMAPNGTVTQWQEDHARQIVEQSRPSLTASLFPTGSRLVSKSPMPMWFPRSSMRQCMRT